MLTLLFLFLALTACNAGKLQLSIYGEAFNTPFNETAYLDCRLSCFQWQNIIVPYLALTKYTTFNEVSPMYGIGLAKNYSKDRFFIDFSTTLYNDKTARFMVFTTFDIIK